MSLENVIRCWQASEGHSYFTPATDASLDALEHQLGYPLPEALRCLYGFSDGFRLVGGDLELWHVGGDELSLWESRQVVRKSGHVIPDEILVFGDNGSEALFGIWLPPANNELFRNPIVEIGQIFEPGCLAVAATSLIPFLVGRTAYYLLTEDEQPTEALDEIGLPADLRFPAEEMGDEQFDQIVRWADPHLPRHHVDPYESRLDAETLRKMFSNATGA